MVVIIMTRTSNMMGALVEHAPEFTPVVFRISLAVLLSSCPFSFGHYFVCFSITQLVFSNDKYVDMQILCSRGVSGITFIRFAQNRLIGKINN